MTDANPFESIRNKIVLVTGATGGLGKAVVPRLLGTGAVVAAAYRTEEKFRALIAAAGGENPSLIGFRSDLTREAEVGGMVEAVLGRFGRIDALLNLAGGWRGGVEVAATKLADWDYMLELNLKTAFLCSRAVLPAMIKQNSGHIVCIGSRQAVEKKGRAKSGAYAVAKAAVVLLTETIAEEARKYGITANCVLPGTIDSPDNRAANPGADYSRWTGADAIADVILFLISEASSITSGAAIPVYGQS